MVAMRVTRRFGPYNVGEMISVPFWDGRDLEAKRLAQPVHLLVPARDEGAPAPEAAPARAVSGQFVKK